MQFDLVTKLAMRVSLIYHESLLETVLIQRFIETIVCLYKLKFIKTREFQEGKVNSPLLTLRISQC